MHRIAIIGLGPRGLSVLDRIIAYARNDEAAKPLELYLFDSREFGPGCHTTDQSGHLLVNTVACQMTQFSDDTVRDAGPLLYGPSFFDWLSRTGKPSVKDGDGGLERNAYYSRALFGDYLRWVFEYMKGHAPAHVTIFLHNYAGVDDLLPRGAGWTVFYDSRQYAVDHVFLTTGHARKEPDADERALAQKVAAAQALNPRAQVIFEPYPIRNATSSIAASDTVAIEGMGLTSFDLISQLTYGRGGKFEERVASGRNRTQRLDYKPSGSEPKILLYSRSGLPLTARAINQKGVFGQYKPKFFTFARLEALKRDTPGGKLDFQSQIMPLLWRDMQFAYYFSYLHQYRDKISAMLFCNAFLICDSDAARQALIDQHVEAGHQLSWDKLVDPIDRQALASPRHFSYWLKSHMRRDLTQARLGNLDSPIKSACDVLRDVRDVVRAAIDFGGLREESHRWVLSQFLPIMNRLAVGPPKERIAELLALMDSGVVRADFGPGAHCVFDEQRAGFVLRSRWPEKSAFADVLLRARAALPGPLEDKSPLMRKMLERGIVCPFMNGAFHPGGITVDRNMNVVNRDGQSQTSLWARGTLVEGCKFYTFVLPRPGANSTTMVDAGRAVGRMMASLTPSPDMSGAGGRQGPLFDCAIDDEPGPEAGAVAALATA